MFLRSSFSSDICQEELSECRAQEKERFFPTLSILTILLDKGQAKSCFEDMNILMKAILKFCITNQLFKFTQSKQGDSSTRQIRIYCHAAVQSAHVI